MTFTLPALNFQQISGSQNYHQIHNIWGSLGIAATVKLIPFLVLLFMAVYIVLNQLSKFLSKFKC